MRPSKISLRAIKGVVSDIGAADLPEGFALESINGRFIPSMDGKSFQWTSVRGEKAVPVSGPDWVSSYRILCVQEFDGFLVAFVWNNGNNNTFIYKLLPSYASDKSIETLTATRLVFDAEDLYLKIRDTNTQTGTHPVQKIRVVRDTHEVYTIYWVDYQGSLKSIRIVNNDGNANLENVSFSQNITYGTINFKGFIAGSLPGAAMFYAYRLLGSNGSVTDWSMAMGPILIPNKYHTGTASFDKYNDIKYAKKGELSACGVSLEFTDLDTRYKKIQICAMLSAENGTFEKGYICHEQDFTNTSLTFSHISERNYGTVLPEEVQISTQTVVGCVDFDLVNNILIVIGPRVDTALITAGATDKIKFNLIEGATAVPNIKQIPFDEIAETATGPAYPTAPLAVVSNARSYPVSKYKIQSTGLPLNYNIITSTGYAGYKNPIHETLMKTCWRGECYRIGMVPVSNFGKRLGVRWICDLEIPERDAIGLSSPNIIDQVSGIRMANVINALVSGIDITQWVHGTPGAETCDIQGFHIVVAPREKRRLNEGALFCAANHDRVGGTDVMEEFGLIMGNRKNDADVNKENYTPKIIDKLYQYYSPDVQNDFLVKPEAGSKMRIEAQQRGDYTTLMPNDYPWTFDLYVAYTGAADNINPYLYTSSGSKWGFRMWNKYFHRMTTADTPAWVKAHDPSLHKECEVLGHYDLDVFNGAFDPDAQAIYIDELARRKFINAYWGQIGMTQGGGTSYNAFGGGAACRLMVLDDHLIKTVNNPFATAFTDGITIVSSMSNASQLYGGQNDSSYANTSYRSCWHYQPINQTVLGHIRKNDGTYVFDNVEVFIGDSYIVPYSVNRLFHSIHYTYNGIFVSDQTDPCPSMAFIVPIQSNVNFTMQEGDGWLKHRSFRWFDAPNTMNYGMGLGIMKINEQPAYGLLERTEFPQFANVVYAQNLYYALPESIFYTDQYPMQLFWSKRRVNAGETDNYRIFPFENNLVIPGEFGSPTAIRAMGETAIIFTSNGIGAVPVDERSAVQDSSGKSLSLARTEGVGRFEIVDRQHALQHILSLSQNGDDFTWFDFKNRDWIYWAKGQKPVSLAENFNFRTALNDLTNSTTIQVNDIYTAFLSPKEIAIYRANADTAKRRSFVFDHLNNLYQGRRDITIGVNVFLNSVPLNIVGGYISSPGFGIQNIVGGQIVSAELTLSANMDRNSKKIFDSFRLTGQNIQEMVLTNHERNPLTSTAKILTASNTLEVYAMVENADDLYVGAIPLTNQYDFLRGYYVTVKLKGLPLSGVTTIFDTLILNIRKDIQ